MEEQDEEKEEETEVTSSCPQYGTSMASTVHQATLTAH